jgi:hypothetical protein
MADVKTIPFYCPLCIDEHGCGYHGLLWFPGSPKPVCTHHTDDTNAPDSVEMRPVSERPD